MSLSVNIKKRIGTFFLDVCFESENNVLALLGASGCGKSMTLKCIAGIEKPDSGKIVLDGKVLFDSEKNINLPPQKRNVGYLFQQYALFPNMTVEKNVEAGMIKIPKEQRRDKVKSLIEKMQLHGLEKKYPSQLSGGQQQRTALARILASSPKVILLDEPFSALDSFLKWQLENELADTLKEFEGDVIWVSHDRDEVYRNCHKICVLDKGKSGNVKGVKELFKNPDTVSAARLTGCKNFAPFEVKEDGTVFIPQWNISLESTFTPSENRKFVGIRARNVVFNGEEDINTVECEIMRVTESTFSVIFMLKPLAAEDNAPLIRVETRKEENMDFNKNDIVKIYIPPAEVMLLE